MPRRPPTDPHLRPALARYLRSLRPPRSSVVRGAEEEAARRGDTIASPEQARLLEALAAIEPAGSVVELGTGSGYATLHLARGARDGRVVSVDRDPAALARARAMLDAAGVGERVDLVESEALAFLAGVRGPFALAVVDVDPDALRRAVDLVLPLLAPGGRLAVLHVFGAGRPGEASRDAQADDWQRERLHPYLLIHPQLASVLLPIGDGIAVGVKQKMTVRELGGPY